MRGKRLGWATGWAVLAGALVTAACGGAADPAEGAGAESSAAATGGTSAGTGGSIALGGAGGSQAAGGGSSSGCADLHVKLTRQTPTVLLLIDQSLSMADAFGDGTRWSVVRDALLDPAKGLVRALDGEVRFGLALYTSLDGSTKGGQCPLLVEVDCAVGNADAIAAAYAAAEPIDDTPTGESLVAVTQKLVALNEPGPKYVVLATDGAPDTCEIPDGQTKGDKADAKAKSVAAAQDAFAKGIRTAVIAIGDGIGTDHLQDLANAGAGLPVGGAATAPYYLALDQGALVGALEAVIDGARSCVFTLDGTVVDGAGASGEVTLDGAQLGYGDADGWKLASDHEIELVGAACAAVQKGDHDLAATFPCGAVAPPK
jgi:hypothetical protein